MDLRLRVDWLKCDGYGTCSDMAPDVIDLDDWGYPILRPIAIEGRLRHDAQRAVDCCPMKALMLDEARSDRRSA